MNSDLIEKSIGRIVMAADMAMRNTGCPLVVCISGGKDSSVIQQLAIDSGAKVKFIHHLTTVDAPETVHFVRDEFERLKCLGYDAEIMRPKKTMWKIIEDGYGFLPNRFYRSCCNALKEVAVYTDETKKKHAFICTGVRWSESSKRTRRGEYEKIGKNIKEAIILKNDNDVERKLFEDCKMKGQRVVNPIIDWTDDDVWQYIKELGLPYNPLYDEGFERVGCVGCPLASKKYRLRDFERYPGYKKAYINAIKRGYQKAIDKGKKPYYESAEEAFEKWLEVP